MTYHRVCSQINTTGVTSGAGTAYSIGAPEFTPRFQWGSCYSIFSFICMFCRSLFVLLYIFFWPLCCLFFFNIQILITPLVSSNSSYNKQLSLLCVFYFSKSDKRRSNNICSILDILPHSVILNWKCSDSVVFFPFSFLYLKLHYILESICLNSCCHWSS